MWENSVCNLQKSITAEKCGDINACDPLFLVKYFNSTALTTDIRFMTNKDTPAIAF